MSLLAMGPEGVKADRYERFRRLGAFIEGQAGVMSVLRLHGGTPLTGRVRIPGDKSISHRALIFNAIASGDATVSRNPGV